MDELFQKILALKNQVFKRAPQSVIGVDVGSSAIKIVELKKRNNVPVLETYGEIALGPYGHVDIGKAPKLPTEELIKALADIIREANVKSRVGGVSIPFTSSLVTMITLPALPPEQLEKMIPIEARKYIPVSSSEVSLDWFVVPRKEGDPEAVDADDADTAKPPAQEAGGGSAQNQNHVPENTVDVLLVAIHNDILAMYRKLITGAAIDASFYEIEIFSTIRATTGQTLAPVAILDFGAGKTKLYIVEFGVVKVSHLINRGSQDLTLSLARARGISFKDAEKMKRTDGLLSQDMEMRDALQQPLEGIFTEANRVLLSYSRKHNRKIGKLILTGGGSVLKGFLPLAQEKLDTDVVLGNPFGKVQAPAFLGDVLKQVGPEFSVAVGLALRKLQDLK